MKSIGWASEEDARQAREAASAPAPFDYAAAPAPFSQAQPQPQPSQEASDHTFAPRGSRNAAASSSASGGRNQQQRPAQASQQAPFDPHANLSTNTQHAHDKRVTDDWCGPGPCIFVGPDGSGKSHILEQAIENRKMVVYLDLQREPGTLPLHSLFPHFC